MLPYILKKKKNKVIDCMKLRDGTLLCSAEEVHEVAVSFFQDLLSVTPVEVHEESFLLLSCRY